MPLEFDVSYVGNALQQGIAQAPEVCLRGKIVEAVGTLVRIVGVPVQIGEICRLVTPGGGHCLLGEVVGLQRDEALVMPLGPMVGLSSTTMVEGTGAGLTVGHGNALQGRVLDGFGRGIDGLPDAVQRGIAVEHAAPDPMARPVIDSCFPTGVRAIDGLLTCGVGQRIGIFAPAGTGKSTLLGMIARGSRADAVVMALIGERGREVAEFLEHNFSEAERQRAIVVASTSDRPAAERIKAAYVATRLAETLREEGKQVLLLFDSLTRFARALREIGLAAGEPPTRRGFPPSVFSQLPCLLERTGRDRAGSITAFYTVLAEDDDGTDPVCEEARSLLDGHIILSSELASSGHFPAIDVLKSRSRVMSQIAGHAHQQAAGTVRRRLAAYRDIELLLKMGEYRAGADAETDAAVQAHDGINAFLRQDPRVPHPWQQTLDDLRQFAA